MIRSRQVEFDLFEAAINVLTLKQAGTSILELFREVKNSPRFRGLPWRGVPWRGVAVLCNPGAYEAHKRVYNTRLFDSEAQTAFFYEGPPRFSHQPFTASRLRFRV